MAKANCRGRKSGTRETGAKARHGGRPVGAPRGEEPLQEVSECVNLFS